MSSNFGNKIKVSIFGESHGSAIGCVVDGFPAGEKVDTEKLEKFMDRRAPAKNKFGTKRNEKDKVEFMSGIVDGILTGSPLTGVIFNRDHRSKDYKNLELVPRPSHADFTAYVKYKGFADMRGGGHFSGRLTAPICMVGGIAKQILERKNIHIGSHLFSIGDLEDDSYNTVNLSKKELELASTSEFPVINNEVSKKMQKLLDDIRMEEDSIGGIIQTGVLGLPIGLGNPMFDGIENKLAKVLFGIPGVKGVEFGSGFEGTKLKGSEHNDGFDLIEGKIVTKTNNNGGIIGGISNGMPVLFKVAMKPTPSISKEQNSINLNTNEREKLVIKGRHDPCIAIRAVPVIEAIAATVVLDLMMEEGYI
ncbi:chorismate synthase [Miniphocaeibacter massiliensis]|uniref:chorismate synthase n=1 Tax=Miniphocaeibacter massiliensis TaxID=2041841 RepID=UPI000C1C4267|nr:chorismate synthase [Miniphocaeibacter massiliensis]